MTIPDFPTQTVRADQLVVGDTLLVPMTEDAETVTSITVGTCVSVCTDGTGPEHAYMWADDEPIDVVSRGGDAR
jgi:hypothetical protein